MSDGGRCRCGGDSELVGLVSEGRKSLAGGTSTSETIDERPANPFASYLEFLSGPLLTCSLQTNPILRLTLPSRPLAGVESIAARRLS